MFSLRVNPIGDAVMRLVQWETGIRPPQTKSFFFSSSSFPTLRRTSLCVLREDQRQFGAGSGGRCRNGHLLRLRIHGEDEERELGVNLWSIPFSFQKATGGTCKIKMFLLAEMFGYRANQNDLWHRIVWRHSPACKSFVLILVQELHLLSFFLLITAVHRKCPCSGKFCLLDGITWHERPIGRICCVLCAYDKTALSVVSNHKKQSWKVFHRIFVQQTVTRIWWKKRRGIVILLPIANSVRRFYLILKSLLDDLENVVKKVEVWNLSLLH